MKPLNTPQTMRPLACRCDGSSGGRIDLQVRAFTDAASAEIGTAEAAIPQSKNRWGPSERIGETNRSRGLFSGPTYAFGNVAVGFNAVGEAPKILDEKVFETQGKELVK